MSKEKFLTAAVVFLLVLNVGIVSFLYLNRPTRPGELWKLVAKEVRFDEQQTKQYLALRDEHRNNMNKLDAVFTQTLNQYLSQLKVTLNPAVEDSLSQQLAAIEKEKAEVTLQHFKMVKKLCRPEQIADFDRIIPELTRVMLPPKKDLPPRRK